VGTLALALSLALLIVVVRIGASEDVLMLPAVDDAIAAVEESESIGEATS